MKGPTARRRAAKTRRRRDIERAIMQQVRERDRVCRRGGASCGTWLEVSHQQHRGMGGNPAMDRTDTRTMVLLCHWHHQDAPVSVDRKTMRWVPLTEAGADGPIAWEWRPEGEWVEILRETTSK